MNPGEFIMLGPQIFVVFRKRGDPCLVELGLVLIPRSGKKTPAQAVIFVLLEDPVVLVEFAQDDLGVILNLLLGLFDRRT